jgi:hypothetical protein
MLGSSGGSTISGATVATDCYEDDINPATDAELINDCFNTAAIAETKKYRNYHRQKNFFFDEDTLKANSKLYSDGNSNHNHRGALRDL